MNIPPASPPVIVIGLGNPILGDDGVGWHVAGLVRSRLDAAGPPLAELCACECLSLGGLRLMEHLDGFTAAIIVDALVTGRHPPGSVLCLPLASLPAQSISHLSSGHDTDLPGALRMGRAAGMRLPGVIEVVGIETSACFEFGETLSRDVAAAVPAAVDAVLGLVEKQLAGIVPAG